MAFTFQPRSPGYPQMGLPPSGIAGGMGGANIGYPQPTGLNPDGSAPPGGVGAGTVAPGMPGGQPPPYGMSGVGSGRIATDNPTAIIENVLAAAGFGPYGGLADTLASIGDADALNTIYSLMSAAQGGMGAAEGDAARNAFAGNLYSGLLGSQSMPTVAQLLGPAWGNASVLGGDITNPLAQLLSAGTPDQQIGMLLSTLDATSNTMNPLILNGLTYALQRLGQMYSSQQAGQGVAPMTFMQYLANNAPSVARQLGA